MIHKLISNSRPKKKCTTLTSHLLFVAFLTTDVFYAICSMKLCKLLCFVCFKFWFLVLCVCFTTSLQSNGTMTILDKNVKQLNCHVAWTFSIIFFEIQFALGHSRRHFVRHLSISNFKTKRKTLL